MVEGKWQVRIRQLFDRPNLSEQFATCLGWVQDPSLQEKPSLIVHTLTLPCLAAWVSARATHVDPHTHALIASRRDWRRLPRWASIGARHAPPYP